MQRKQVAQTLLIAAIVAVFALFGVDKFRQPLFWIGWIPMWMDGLFTLSRDAWLKVIGLSEIMLAALVLIPVRRVRQIGVILVCLHLVAILTQTGWNDVGIRDAGLLLSALALLFLI